MIVGSNKRNQRRDNAGIPSHPASTTTNHLHAPDAERLASTATLVGTPLANQNVVDGECLPPRLDGKPFLQLADGWALAADKNQWIICRRRSRDGETCWQPRSYIGSNKAVLSQVLRELGIEVRPEANAAAHAFLSLPPHRFLEWRSQVMCDRKW